MGKPETENPTPYSLRFSENALRNLDEITGYIAFIRHQPLNALSIGTKFFETIERIKKILLPFVNVKKFQQVRKSIVKLYAPAG
jgi:hypothetical protein